MPERVTPDGGTAAKRFGRRAGAPAPGPQPEPIRATDLEPELRAPDSLLPEEETEELIRPMREQADDPAMFSVEAKVIYRGTNAYKGTYYRGSLQELPDQTDPEGQRLLRIPNFKDGALYYDFARLDSRRRVIRERLIDDEGKVGTGRGRPFTVCHHIGHLVRFLQDVNDDGEPQFELRATRPVKVKLDRFMRIQAEAKRRNRDMGEAVLADMQLI